jgi:hypothetical protein
MSRRNGDDLDDSHQEAIESQEHIQEESVVPQSEEEGEDLIEDA